MDKYVNQSTVGQFILDGTTYFGSLSLDDSANRKVLLTLYLEQGTAPIPYRSYPEELVGTLYDLTKVTLLDCVFVSSGFHSKSDFDGGVAISGQLVFDVGHVLFSDSPLDASQVSFDSLEFSVTNSNDLFNFSSFTQVVHANEQFVKELVQQDLNVSKGRYGFSSDISKYSFGDSPIVLVYTGANKLSELDIGCSELEIRNNPNYTAPSNDGFKFENSISCRLNFKKPKTYWGIVAEIATIKQLFELILGTRQSLKSYILEVKNINDSSSFFKVFREADHPKVTNNYLHPANRLVHIESEEDEFSTIIENWISSEEEWKFSRQYYFSVFAKREYNPDNLVKLSNMFDLIPDSAYEKETVADEILNAAKSCKAIFKPLPISLERESILLALKRVGSKTLKHKIRDRYKIIQESVFFELTDMGFVIDQSVDCRNFFVHGSNKKFDYLKEFNELRFFIDTLIFIYGVSEMIQNGWTFSKWKPSALNNHPFSEYVRAYDVRLEGLKKALDSK